MTLMFELSKDQSALSYAEVIACLEAEKVPHHIIDANEDVIIVDVKPNDAIIKDLAGRLAFTFIIDEFLFSCPATIDEIGAQAKRHPLQAKGTIAIRCKNRGSHLDMALVIDRLGDVYTKNRKVDLSHPEVELRAVVTFDTMYFGIKKAEINTSRFQQRRGHLRPFLSPITMHPKIARALVNLSSVQKNEVLLDPFCGTGGILIEAMLMGIRVVGNDIEKKMIEGCRKNLEFYHLKDYELYCMDIADIADHVRSVDAVVTDFPYAKATTTKGEKLQKLYNRGFETISRVLGENKRAVIGLSSEEMVTMGENYLRLVNVFPIRAHRSLTRYFVVYQKK
jgi:tRNA (guanine10-N2)-dimethyltransferase